MPSVIQTTAVTIISYKPSSDLNLIRYIHTILWQLHALFSFGVYKPWTLPIQISELCISIIITFHCILRVTWLLFYNLIGQVWYSMWGQGSVTHLTTPFLSRRGWDENCVDNHISYQWLGNYLNQTTYNEACRTLNGHALFTCMQKLTSDKPQWILKLVI